MGWADKAIWRHVTGLVGATLHKCEDTEKQTVETLEPAAAAAGAAAATCIHTEQERTPRDTSADT